MPNKPRNWQLLVIATFTDSCKIYVKQKGVIFILYYIHFKINLNPCSQHCGYSRIAEFSHVRLV